MSNNAKLHFILRNNTHRHLPSLLRKTEVLYPAVEDHAAAYEHSKNRKKESPFALLFVGNDFFRKGGLYVCKAFSHLKKHFPIRLTVISSMEHHSDFFPVTANDVRSWKSEMQNLGITHLSAIPNEEVRRLMGQSDLVLLPTLEDSFGFSLVEAMAAGVPAIATAVEAIPEIIQDNATGYLIPVETQQEGRLVWSKAVEESITQALIEKTAMLLSDASTRLEFSRQARLRYERMFHPSVIGHQLRVIYDEALKT